MQVFDILFEGRLIILDDEKVIGSLVLDQESCGLPLGVQSIGGYDAPFEGKILCEFSEFWYLVGFLLHCYLANHQGLFVQDGAEQMRWLLISVMSSTQGFPIHGDRFAGQGRLFEDPFTDLGIEFFSIDTVKDSADGRFRGWFTAF